MENSKSNAFCENLAKNQLLEFDTYLDDNNESVNNALKNNNIWNAHSSYNNDYSQMLRGAEVKNEQSKKNFGTNLKFTSETCKHQKRPNPDADIFANIFRNETPNDNRKIDNLNRNANSNSVKILSNIINNKRILESEEVANPKNYRLNKAKKGGIENIKNLEITEPSQEIYGDTFQENKYKEKNLSTNQKNSTFEDQNGTDAQQSQSFENEFQLPSQPNERIGSSTSKIFTGVQKVQKCELENNQKINKSNPNEIIKEKPANHDFHKNLILKEQIYKTANNTPEPSKNKSSKQNYIHFDLYQDEYNKSPNLTIYKQIFDTEMRNHMLKNESLHKKINGLKPRNNLVTASSCKLHVNSIQEKIYAINKLDNLKDVYKNNKQFGKYSVTADKKNTMPETPACNKNTQTPSDSMNKMKFENFKEKLKTIESKIKKSIKKSSSNPLMINLEGLKFKAPNDLRHFFDFSSSVKNLKANGPNTQVQDQMYNAYEDYLSQNLVKTAFQNNRKRNKINSQDTNSVENLHKKKLFGSQDNRSIKKNHEKKSEKNTGSFKEPLYFNKNLSDAGDLDYIDENPEYITYMHKLQRKAIRSAVYEKDTRHSASKAETIEKIPLKPRSAKNIDLHDNQNLNIGFNNMKNSKANNETPTIKNPNENNAHDNTLELVKSPSHQSLIHIKENANLMKIFAYKNSNPDISESNTTFEINSSVLAYNNKNMYMKKRYTKPSRYKLFVNTQENEQKSQINNSKFFLPSVTPVNISLNKKKQELKNVESRSEVDINTKESIPQNENNEVVTVLGYEAFQNDMEIQSNILKSPKMERVLLPKLEHSVSRDKSKQISDFHNKTPKYDQNLNKDLRKFMRKNISKYNNVNAHTYKMPAKSSEKLDFKLIGNASLQRNYQLDKKE